MIKCYYLSGRDGIEIKKALVAGATGLVGRSLVYELLESGIYSEIRILARRKTEFSDKRGVQEHIIDFDELARHESILEGIDDVFVTLGTTMKKAETKDNFIQVDYTYPVQLAELAKQSGAKRFLIITAAGSDPKSPFFYSRVKGQLEEKLLSLGLPSLHIFRPSLLTGERDEFRLGEKAAEAASRKLSTLFRGPLEKYKPVEGRFVAAAMKAIAQEESSGTYLYESDKISDLGMHTKKA